MAQISVDRDALSELLDVAADLASVTNLIAEHGAIPRVRDVERLTWRLTRAIRAVARPLETEEPTVLEALREVAQGESDPVRDGYLEHRIRPGRGVE